MTFVFYLSSGSLFNMESFIGLLLTMSLPSILASSSPLILTDLIKRNLTEQAREQAAVNSSLFLGRTSYSGFFNVDEKHNGNLFFWYIEAESRSPNTPWIIWLQGGPGVTSLSGLFDEIGPFQMDGTSNNITARKWTWSRDHSLLFIDNPVGVGFSFADNSDGYPQSVDQCASHLYKALRQFLMVFPELRKAPLYIAGESYAGRYVPALGAKILEQDHSIGPLEVNFQGIMLGNPVINRESIVDYSSVFYNWGIIDAQGLLAVKPLQDSYTKAVKDGNVAEAALAREALLTTLDDMAKQQNDYNILLDRIDHLDAFIPFVTRPDISEALHVGDSAFSFSEPIMHAKLQPDFLMDVRTKVQALLDNHLRVLIYCGQMDVTAPCVPNAEARRKEWRWNGHSQFLSAPRTPWWLNNRVAGYVKSGGGLTEVLIRGAGHLAPMDKPEEVTNLITNFIQGADLKQPPYYRVVPKDTPEYIVHDESQYPVQDTVSGPSAGVIVSIILNVLCIPAIVCLVYYALRWRRRNHLLLSMENTSLDSAII